MAIIFFLIDGLGDKGRNTPLKLAKKPNINSLSNKSFLGQILPLSFKDWPKQGEGSVTPLANLGILGYKNLKNIKRGPLEAVGSGIKLKKEHLALRVDFASVDKNLVVLDRRAQRNTYGLDILEKEINKLSFKVPFYFQRVYGHRGVLIFKKNLSFYISDSDPYKINVKAKKIKALKKDKLSIYTAQVIQEFLNLTHKFLDSHPINLEREKLGILKANYLLIREAGKLNFKLENFFKKYKIKNGLAVAEKGAFLGSCLLVGFKPLIIPEIKNIEERYKFYKKVILENIEKYKLIYLHLKEADEASHDKNFEKKKNYFEFFDSWFGDLMKNLPQNVSFVITGDHITDTQTGKHKFGFVPILIINHPHFPSNNPKDFSEEEVKRKKEIIKSDNLWKKLKI